jgi:hypothetical protein
MKTIFWLLDDIWPIFPPPPSCIKQFIEAQLTASWNKEWSLSKKSAITHDFLPSVTLQRPLASLHKPFLLCKVISSNLRSCSSQLSSPPYRQSTISIMQLQAGRRINPTFSLRLPKPRRPKISFQISRPN